MATNIVSIDLLLITKAFDVHHSGKDHLMHIFGSSSKDLQQRIGQTPCLCYSSTSLPLRIIIMKLYCVISLFGQNHNNSQSV